MKKLLIILCGFIICFGMSGCGTQKNTNVDDTNKNAEVSENFNEEIKNIELDETVIRSLMEENINCMTNIFVLSSLPTEGEALRDNIYKVDSSKYKNYSEFENYIRSVYCNKTSEMLLKDYPYEGEPKYLNIDGNLFVDLNKGGGKGYYVDWNDYEVKITKSDINICEFTLISSIEEPSDAPKKEQYTVKSSAIYENGKWLLKEMIH